MLRPAISRFTLLSRYDYLWMTLSYAICLSHAVIDVCFKYRHYLFALRHAALLVYADAPLFV